MSYRARSARAAALALSGGVALTMAAAVLLSGPAFAEGGKGPFNEEPGRPLGTGPALLLYVGVPLAILLVTASLVWLPGVARGSRYRPQRGWTAPPLWFGGPAQLPEVPPGATNDGLVRGGAHGEW